MRDCILRDILRWFCEKLYPHVFDKNELESTQLKLNSPEDLILTIHSMLKGWDKNVFYKIELGEGNVNGQTYSIPKMTYYRRRKI